MKPKKITPNVVTVQDLYLRSTRRPGSQCWYWQGGQTGRGTPSIYTIDYVRAEKRGMSVCLAVWSIANKAPPPVGAMLYRCCAERSCVNPDHVLIGQSQSQILRAAFRTGRKMKPSMSADQKVKVAANLGLQVIPDGVALAVLTSTGTCTEVAQAHGIGRSTVSRIRAGRTHKHLHAQAACRINGG